MNTTYPINYDNSTFFSSSQNIAATFPFTLSDVIAWAKTAPKPLSDGDAPIDLFDSKLSAVITNPGNETSFLSFLDNKMYLNSYFGTTAISSSNIVSYSIINNTMVNIKGTSFNGSTITSTDGSTSYLLGNPGRQRVLYRDVCTKHHLHFSNCAVEKIVPQSDPNEYYYQCRCTGTPEFNNNPHSHCSQFTNNETDVQASIDRFYYGLGGNRSQRGASSQTAPGANTYIVRYANSDMLNQTHTEIRKIIYLYYVAVNENFIYKAALEKNKNLSNTTNQLLSDSTVKYKNHYLNMFNLLSGIIIAGGYIYMLR